jgi:hypothetical protein
MIDCDQINVQLQINDEDCFRATVSKKEQLFYEFSQVLLKGPYQPKTA